MVVMRFEVMGFRLPLPRKGSSETDDDGSLRTVLIRRADGGLGM